MNEIIESIKKLEQYYFIKAEKTIGKINRYTLLKLTDNKLVKKVNQSKLVKNKHGTSKNKALPLVKNKHTNNTNKEQDLNKENTKGSKYKFTLSSMTLAQLLYSLIKKQNPAWYVEPSFEQWASDIDKIHRIDKRTYKQIEYVIRWTQKDDFWKKNILSPSKLRKQFNTLVVRITNNKKRPKII